MARLYHSGFEIHNASGSVFGPDGREGSGGGTRSTVNPRTGAACLRITNDAGSFIDLGGIVASGTGFVRGYMSWSSLPASTVVVFHVGSVGTEQITVRLTAAGKLQLFNNVAGTQIGSDSAATISPGTYYNIEVKAIVNGSTAVTDVELKLDLVSVASATGLSVAGTGRFIYRGLAGAGITTDLDDVAWNDATGGTNNTWCGDGKVVLMKPSSDTQAGSWTGGVGGTTNLWDAVDNTPPVGTAAETDTSQIESADSSGDNATDEYRGNCGTYTAAGIGASDTINSIVAFCSHGEDVTTNTKTGSFGLQSNPAVAYTTFTYGDDSVVAVGTWFTGWKWKLSAFQETPSVTKGSSLILAVRKTDAGTRVASVCFLGAYVEYTPAAVSSFVAPPVKVLGQAVKRGSVF